MSDYLRIKQASLINAVKTPYLENGKIDFDCFGDLLTRLVQYKVDGVIVGGTTGEGHLLNWEEHIALIGFAAANFSDDLIIIGNTGSNSTAEAIYATEFGFAVGMDAALQINPYYGKTSSTGLIRHFKTLLSIGPAMIYNVPSRTAQDISEEVVLELAQHEHFLGIKECAGNERIQRYADQGIACWSGNDDQCFEARHSCRAAGVVSVVGNLLPNVFRQLMDDPNAVSQNQLLSPILEAINCEPNPIGLNTVMAMVGLCRPVFRLPYCPMSLSQRETLADLLEALNFKELTNPINVLFDEEFIFI